MISSENKTTGQEKLLKSIYWDYNIDPAELLAILYGIKPATDIYFTKERIFIRMLERLNWMDIVSILSKDQSLDLLTPDVISNPELKNCEKDMNSCEKWYRENLYPSQDGMMSIIKKLNTPFYLTGGTALSFSPFPTHSNANSCCNQK